MYIVIPIVTTENLMQKCERKFYRLKGNKTRKKLRFSERNSSIRKGNMYVNTRLFFPLILKYTYTQVYIYTIYVHISTYLNYI